MNVVVKLPNRTAWRYDLREAGRNAMLLWFAVLAERADRGPSGDLYWLLVRTAGRVVGVNPAANARRLVENGVWHDHQTVRACDECMARGGELTEERGYFLHNWWDLLIDMDLTPSAIRGQVKRHRAAVLERYGHQCVVCCASEDLHVDHVLPIARGGKSDPENLTVLCAPHNMAKGAQTWQEWTGSTWADWLKLREIT